MGVVSLLMYTHRHEFQHFVGVMEGYITNQLFYLSWRELEEDMATKVNMFFSLKNIMDIEAS